MHLVLNFLGLYTLYSTVIFKSNSTSDTSGCSRLLSDKWTLWTLSDTHTSGQGIRLPNFRRAITSRASINISFISNRNADFEKKPQGPLKRIKARNSKTYLCRRSPWLWCQASGGSPSEPEWPPCRAAARWGTWRNWWSCTSAGRDQRWNISKQTTRPSGARRRLCSCGTVAESGGLESILHSKVLPGTTQTVSWISGMSSASSLSAPSTTSCQKKREPKSWTSKH